jgi:hypothetical protein
MSHAKLASMGALLLLGLIAIRNETDAAGPATVLSAGPSAGPSSKPVTTQPAVDPQAQLKAWWADLARPEPFSTRALLDFASHPDQAVVFIKENLKPLKLEASEVEELIKALGSDDEKVWKPAFEKMQYLDPRLAEGIGALLDAVEGQTARNRLIEILSDLPADQLKGSTVLLRRNGEYWLFYSTNPNGGTRSWYVEPKVSKLDFEGQARKKLWQRADRAVVLLQHIGTPAAIAVLKEMATGNPEAQPTKIAKLAVDSLGEGE